jgi:hypothetical protein
MAIEFIDTSNHGLDWGDPSLLRAIDPLSMTAWIYPTGWGGNSLGRIMAKEGYVAGQWGWLWFLRNSAGQASMEFWRYRSTAQATILAVNSSISLNTWQFVAVTYSSSGSDLYKDGVQLSYATDTAGSGTVNTDSGYNGFIGNNQNSSRGFDGLIEDPRIYNKVLSLAEIQSIYTGQGHDGVRENLLARWPLREKAPGVTISTDSAYDITDNKTEAVPDDSAIEYAEGLISFRRRV